MTQDNVRVIARRPVSTGYKLSGSARGSDGQRVRPLLHVNHEGHIIEASCTCAFYKKSKLTQGPCEHVLGTAAGAHESFGKGGLGIGVRDQDSGIRSRDTGVRDRARRQSR